jgi:glutamate--cysteine ligase
MPPSSTTFINAIKGQSDLLTFNRGIEREALRVTQQGQLASTPHPDHFGSKLTHPKVTTDFSESQLELITPTHPTPADAIKDLDEIHRYIYTGLGDEILWSASMPCVLQSDDTIPLAYFGNSNLGRLKTTYRNGLGNRYGRGMQTICAVHYNFSFPDRFWTWLHQHEGATDSLQTFQTRRYFDLMRNFRRYSWLLTYLFGASPAVCKSFVKDKQHSLSSLDDGTFYLPEATSLRSGNLGYQSDAQASNMNICYNSLEDYVGTLANAICQQHEPYDAIGVVSKGDYQQVNANILQSEAEFYSSIRAKRVPEKGENFLARLLKDGVQYIEVRLLDVNPYLPLGIDESEIRFLDAFLLYCLVSDSPVHDDQICEDVKTNAQATVHNGRSPGLTLHDNGQTPELRQWGAKIVNEVNSFAQLLDTTLSNDGYVASVDAQLKRLQDPDQTPSGTIVQDMARENIPFFRFAMNQALSHRQGFVDNPLPQSVVDHYAHLAQVSMAEQSSIEAADDQPFDVYLQDIADSYLPLRTP